MLHQVVLDDGVGGEQTSAGLTRLHRVLAAVKPSRVYVLEGINDLRAGRKVPAILADLTQMLQAVTHARATPVLLTVLPTALKSPTNAQVRALNRRILALGARRQVPTVNLYPLFAGRLDLLIDGVHPDDFGYALIAAACARTMA
jgi:lysophospholipase L1-like esterase